MDVKAETSNEAIAYPSYATIHQHISSSSVQYGLVVNCPRFYITMLAENLQSEGDLVGKLQKSVDDPYDIPTIVSLKTGSWPRWKSS